MLDFTSGITMGLVSFSSVIVILMIAMILAPKRSRH